MQADRYVPLPAPVRSVVGVDHPVDGPSVFWNYERNAGYVVLSEQALRESNYVDVGRYSIYDVEPGDGADGRIRPPADLDAVVRSNFVTGQQVFYLAYEAMEAGDNGTVFLLTASQFRQLLPTGVQDPADGANGRPLRDAVLDLPAFLPPP